MTNVVYENATYQVHLDSEPYTHEGEPMNWLVVNKEYQTVEASTSALPNAISGADQFDIVLRRLLEKEQVATEGVTVN